MSNEQVALAAPGAMIGGRYRIDRVLGQGGMGAVYAAENVFLRAPVAIKVLKPGVAQNEEFSRRFVQEAQAAAQVRHPNVVSVLDFGIDETSGFLYLVQEFLTGVDLKEHLQRFGPMEPRAAIELLLPLMRALSYAHSKGVVHRDLKTANVFLCETPEGVVPKVIDFGIAKVVDAEGRSAQDTRSLLIMGTPQYMSPEQACGDRAVDHRTDVWAMGVLLYHMLTKRFPYEGSTASLVLAGIIHGQPVRIEARAPHLPSDVAALVHGAVCPDIAQRFPTMDAFWDAARRCSVMGGAAQLPPTRGAAPGGSPTPPPTGTPPTEGPDTGDPQVTTRRPPPPKSAVWAIAVAVTLVLVSAGVAAHLSKATPPVAPSPDAAPTGATRAPSLEAASITAPPETRTSTVTTAPPARVDAPDAGTHAAARTEAPSRPDAHGTRGGRPPRGERTRSPARPSHRTNVVY